MTRSVPAQTDTAAARRDFALGALAAAGHEIEDPVTLDLVDQLAAGDIEFETFKQAVIERHEAE
ncbi:hypothetical protein [Corynebacterium sp. Marseille-P4321]|uniref:hypothetical protein n=1 Tax=Corynebacterium sp. Marseille-P4321 TaxID=2736603 RepID=UPI00158CF791|nr:hypothetical protein [Corynebacterium sp. Marseille-P4321]